MTSYYIYIYTNKELELKNIYLINISLPHIMDEIFKINKKLKLYIYIKIVYDISNLSINNFISFLSLVLHSYSINLKENYKLIYNGCVQHNGIQLVQLIENLITCFKNLNISPINNVNNSELSTLFLKFLNNNIIIDLTSSKKLTSYIIKNQFMIKHNINKNNDINIELNKILNTWIQNHNLTTKQYLTKTYTIKYIHNIYFKQI